jgi:hypothetical protein
VARAERTGYRRFADHLAASLRALEAEVAEG